jgi:molybdopterin molybdotransferase
MISVEEARARIFAGLRPMGDEIVALAEGPGRVLAAPVVARLTQPPADVSAMDGYALRTEDATAGARLKLIGEAPAGRPFAGRVEPGEAVRIFTGSFVPEGADTILIQENADAADGFVTVRESPGQGRHIRRAGQDFAAGDALLPAGRRMTAREIALAAAGNNGWLRVHRRPRVAVLATGDEIALPGAEIRPGGIANSNTPMLAAFIAAHGGEPVMLPPVPDDGAAIASAVEAARGADMLVTTGGASVGAHDLVLEGLSTEGFVLDFWKIAMRPGKPLLFGQLGNIPVLGLPGNPVSAFVCAVLFLGPALRLLAGGEAAVPRLEPARLGAALKPNDTREDYLRARLERDEAGWVAVPLAVQDSAVLTALAQAQALIRRPPYQEALAPGAMVEIIRLDDGIA